MAGVPVIGRLWDAATFRLGQGIARLLTRPVPHVLHDAGGHVRVVRSSTTRA